MQHCISLTLRHRSHIDNNEGYWEFGQRAQIKFSTQLIVWIFSIPRTVPQMLTQFPASLDSVSNGRRVHVAFAIATTLTQSSSQARRTSDSLQGSILREWINLSKYRSTALTAIDWRESEAFVVEIWEYFIIGPCSSHFFMDVEECSLFQWMNFASWKRYIVDWIGKRGRMMVLSLGGILIIIITILIDKCHVGMNNIKPNVEYLFNKNEIP